MTQAEKDYQRIFELSNHIRTLKGILSLLNWDQETYMPQGSADIRSTQIETLAGMIHKDETNSKYSKALGKLIDLKTGAVQADGLKPPQQSALKEWYRDWKRSNSLPASFVKKFSKLTSQSILVWRKAKEENNFQQFAPYLDKLVSMSRKKADYLGWKDHPYDALIDLYEHDVSTAEIEKLFKQLKTPIHELLEQITEKKQVRSDFLDGRFAKDKQLEFANTVLKDMGYDFAKGRLDISAHPFSTSMHPTDSRITTRIHPTCIMSNISVVLHEGGHSLYEMGLPVDQYGSPLGDPISLGMHECQSRFWETRIGQSKPFWKHYLPILKKTFKGKFDRINLETFYRGINIVEPTFIRVDADEVTYPLHIILRFEMEKGLIDGSIKVRDVPEIWNAKMTELLGITPTTNREGCLQDIHWAMGGFGYFPSYTLGTLYASHLFEAFAKEFSDWEQKIGEGNLIFIRDWLADVIYQHGRRYSSLELLKKVTGKKLTSDAFIEYLNAKYSDIYKL